MYRERVHFYGAITNSSNNNDDGNEETNDEIIFTFAVDHEWLSYRSAS